MLAVVPFGVTIAVGADGAAEGVGVFQAGQARAEREREEAERRRIELARQLEKDLERRRAAWMEQRAAERAQNQRFSEEKRTRCRRSVELLQQPRVAVPWSPARHAQFPGCRRKQGARSSWPLMRQRFWNAGAVSKSEVHDYKQIVKDEWLDFVVRFVSEQVRPITRVVQKQG